MGLDVKHTQFLLAARNHGVSFTKTVTIGRQFLHLNLRALRGNLRKSGRPLPVSDARRILEDCHGACEPLLRLLGATTTDSIDVSDYEGASIIHDMNERMPREHHEQYSAVVDSGSLEHIFDFLTAVHGCMQLVQPGGHFLGIMPANNQMGHGLYQFSPELLFRLFSPPNGFSVDRVLVSDTTSSRWFEVTDPVIVRDRVERLSSRPTYLYIQAKKIARTPDELCRVQQSDYEVVWGGESLQSQQTVRNPVLRWVRATAPSRLLLTAKGLWQTVQAVTELGTRGRAFHEVDVCAPPRARAAATTPTRPRRPHAGTSSKSPTEPAKTIPAAGSSDREEMANVR